MKLALLVYFAGIANSISLLFAIITALAVSYALYTCCFVPNLGEERIYSFDSDKEKAEKKAFNDSLPELKAKASAKVKLVIFGALITGFFSAIIPSEKTIYLMAGAYATEQIALNERVQKIGSDVLEVIETKLGEMKKSDSTKKEAKANAEG
ncbi:hypothetical protein AWW72_03715 [Acinetobacter sp. NRRL B-65365]|uniref:hypothetical protein n=1 Tax=Acinetobacter sp. NRRL B-65365 TaxID=1785092 RepID=UPI00079FDA32|nr:hypothetical protein [Acinetobacter sp. NRRL B-65365]KYQ80372.1 hypothetical protein AWW72_03715 [Acinetobacter sp. NRRL B-65365]